MKAILALVALTGHAFATPCAPTNGSVRWVTTGGSAIACFPTDSGASEQCFAIRRNAAPKLVGIPAVQQPPARSRGELRIVNGAPSACVGTRCVALGKHAADAVADARAELRRAYPGGTAEVEAEAFTITGDGKALVIERGGNRAVWSVPGDRELALVPPRGRYYALMSVQVASGAMIATWSNCAGPCGRSILVDSAGKNRGRWFGAGTAIGIDANRIAIVPTDEGATFRVLDAATGAVHTNVRMMRSPGDMPAVRIDSSTLLVLQTGHEPDGHGIWEFRFMAVPAGKPAAFGARVLLPWCPP